MQILNSATNTASSWDSFKETLEKVLDIIKPKRIFEYGPGVSTQIMAKYPTVELIDSVEHDLAWYGKWKWNMPDNVNLMLQNSLELYPDTQGRVDQYDLIFIDGREREKCLYVAKERIHHVGVVMLHDAERPAYKPMIDSYEFKFYTDDGHTVTLTDNYLQSLKLEKLYEDSHTSS